jgi:putative DNA methylase
MMAIVSEVNGRRIFRSPDSEDIDAVARLGELDSALDQPIDPRGQGIRVTNYGIDTWAQLFPSRQLHTLNLLVELVGRTYDRVLEDGGDVKWAEAIVTFLALAVGKRAQVSSTETPWKIDSRSGAGKVERAFARPDLPMTWDYPEAAVLDDGAGSWIQCVKTMLAALPLIPAGTGSIELQDARQANHGAQTLIATDPPYFEAIGYADVSDYFYLWHRQILREVFPDLYSTILTPKSLELIASPGRHGGDMAAARAYFIEGFTETFNSLRGTPDGLPMIVVYASKEQGSGGDALTRWASILTAMVEADLEITGTWPIHGTGSTRMRAQASNAVASYIAMVCRARPESAGTTSLSDFARTLRRELSISVKELQATSILPVDLGQAAMGPGMRVYSRYRAVLDQAGSRVGVDQALTLISSVLGEVLDEQEGDLDATSRLAAQWWATFGWGQGPFGDADQLARPLGISVDDVVRAGLVSSQAGKVQLTPPTNLDRRWTPQDDRTPTAWEAVHHLADRLIDGGGEVAAAELMGHLGALRDPAMALAYRLHEVAVRNSRTADQERYNALISSWAELVRVSSAGTTGSERLF